MIELVSAKEARALTDEYRTNYNIREAIRVIEIEIMSAAAKGLDFTTTKVIMRMWKHSEIDIVISTLKSKGYQVESREEYYELNIHNLDEAEHIISW